MLGHGLVKATMFVVAGRILAAEGSSRIDDVHGLLARRPDLARPLLAGTAALLGFPPFVLFFTEVAIVIAGWANGLGWRWPSHCCSCWWCSPGSAARSPR